MLAERHTRDLTPMSSVDAALAWHDGDARATIETLLRDCDHLRQQIEIARGCISRGLTRGWVPELERRED